MKGNEIVIIDDQPFELECINLYLERFECKGIKVFNSPIEALSEIGNTVFPSLVITDFMMPIMNGLDLAICIANKLPQTKVIIYTGIPELVDNVNNKFTIVDKGNLGRLIEVVGDVLRDLLLKLNIVNTRTNLL